MPALGALDPVAGASRHPVGGTRPTFPWRRGKLPLWGWPLAALAAAAVVIARRPDAVTHAQFYAEDGVVWFASAYNHGGLSNFLTPYNGYLQTLSRLAAALFVPLGLRWAPLAFNLVAITVQVAPALLLLSSRLDEAAPLPGRAVLAAIYLLIPSFELDANLTNAQWHLAVLATLVVVATAPRGWVGRAFDVAVLVLSALTGPFGFLLILVLGIRWLRTRQRWLLVLGVLCLLCEAGQLTVLLWFGRPAGGGLGATPSLLLQIVANKVVLDGLLAQDLKPVLFLTPGPGTGYAAGLIDLGAGAIVLAALVRGPEALRLFILVAAGVLVAGLVSPLVSAQHEWSRIDVAGVGQRYFVMAEYAWLASLLWAVTRIRLRPVAALSVAVVGAAMAIGLAAAWQYPPFYNDHPELYAQRLAAAPPGSTFTAPINPPGWALELTVKQHPT